MSNSGGASMRLDFDRMLGQLARQLDKARVPYMVIGGQAVLEHGRPRLTEDIDLTLGIPPRDLDRLLRAIGELGLTPSRADAREFVNLTHVLPTRQQDSPLRVDFSMTDSPYELQAIARGVDVVIDGVPVRFATAEDLVIHKVIAWRGRDIDDIEGVLLKNPGMDTAYIRHWLAQFADVLEQPLVERFDELWRKCQGEDIYPS